MTIPIANNREQNERDETRLRYAVLNAMLNAMLNAVQDVVERVNKSFIAGNGKRE
jgi:hypothetical protein